MSWKAFLLSYYYTGQGMPVTNAFTIPITAASEAHLSCSSPMSKASMIEHFQSHLIDPSLQGQKAQGHQADALRPAPMSRPGAIQLPQDS